MNFNTCVNWKKNLSSIWTNMQHLFTDIYIQDSAECFFYIRNLMGKAMVYVVPTSDRSTKLST